jgi:hypothetical protein
MTARQREQEKREKLEAVLAGIRATPREEWLRRFEEYENETGDEPLIGHLDAKYLPNGNLAYAKNGHKTRTSDKPA